MANSEKHLLVNIQDGVAVLTLNRPEKLNALSPAMLQQAIATLEQFATDPAAGAGFGIALACDLRVASDKAKFTTAFAKVGFGGDFGITWPLTRIVGQAK